MTIIHPWSLERLLQAAHQEDAISGTIDAKNDKYSIKLQTSRRATEGDFTYISAEINMRRAWENVFSVQQVHSLASVYGGNTSLRLILENKLNLHPSLFFDIAIDDGKIQCDEKFRMLHMPPGEFSPRPLLRDVCRILHLQYQETEQGIFLPKEQQPLITPETIRDTYQRMKISEYVPSISSMSSSSPRAGFDLYQCPAPEGIHQILSIHFGQQSSRENLLTREEILRLQKTLLEYCPRLPQLNFTWRTETAKDLEGWEEVGLGP